MPLPEEAVATWLAAFVAQEVRPERVEAWVERVAGAVVAQTPEIGQDADLADLVHATVREQWQAFLTGLAGPRTEPALVDSAAQLATALARGHHDLPVLLAAYRIAQREAWSYAVTVTEQAPAEIDRAIVLVDIWTRAGDWLDHATDASVLVHQDEQRRIRRSGTAQRFELVRALLAGHELEQRELILALGGHPLAGTHTAMVLRAASTEAMARLEPTAHALAGGTRPLLVEPGGRELWAWLPGTAAALAGVNADVESGVDAGVESGVDAGVDVPAGILVAVGGAAQGPEGFRSSHEEAVAAMRFALAQPAPAALTHHDRIAALRFLAEDPAAAYRFVHRTLGDLAQEEPGRARLRETVGVLLGSAGVEEAAQVLGVHKNTVRYRVAQAEELLGRPITERRGDLDLALRYLAAFPDPPA